MLTGGIMVGADECVRRYVFGCLTTLVAPCYRHMFALRRALGSVDV